MRGPGIEAIARACTSLTHLDFTDSDHLPDTVFRTISEHCHGLKSLHFRNCRKLTNESLNAIISTSTALHRLDIGGCVKIREKSIEHIAKHGASLTELHLNNLPLFETSASAALARGCTALRYLDLSECANVNHASVRGRSAVVVGVAHAHSRYSADPMLTRHSLHSTMPTFACVFPLCLTVDARIKHVSSHTCFYMFLSVSDIIMCR